MRRIAFATTNPIEVPYLDPTLFLQLPMRRHEEVQLRLGIWRFRGFGPASGVVEFGHGSWELVGVL